MAEQNAADAKAEAKVDPKPEAPARTSRVSTPPAQLPDWSAVPHTSLMPGPALASAHAPFSSVFDLAPPAPLPNPEFPHGAPIVPTHGTLQGMSEEDAIATLEEITNPEVLDALGDEEEQSDSPRPKVVAAAKKQVTEISKPAK